MKVVVDFESCEANAACMQAAPQVFEVRDDDHLYVLQEHPADDLREIVERAAAACPMAAIRIED